MKGKRVEEMLRATRDREIEAGMGRVAMRVRGRMEAGGSSAPIAQSSGRWQERWHGLAALVVAGMIVVAVWVAVNQSRPARAIVGVRITAAFERSAERVRGLRVEGPIVNEARRLRSELERGVGFVKAVMPRVRVNG